MEAVMEQYQTHGNKIVDMDIEHVMSYVADRDYSDPLFNDAFWAIVGTYFRDEIKRVKGHPHVIELIERPDLAAYLVEGMGLQMIMIDKHDEKFPTNLHEWFEGVEYGVILWSTYGPSEMAPGASRSHAIVMAMMQYARELSSMHLNPQSIEGVSRH